MSRTGLLVLALLHRLRRLQALAAGAAGLGVLALILGLAAWGARLEWFNQPSWVLVAWGATGAALVGLVLAGHRSLRQLSAGWMAGQLEALGFRRGALGGHLESAAPGTSPALLEAADLRQAEELSSRAPALARTVGEPFRRRARRAGLTLLGGAVVLVSARPTRGTAALLWHPRDAWTATVAPLRIRISDREVDRGARVRVDMEALGRQHAILWVRAPGEQWRGQGVRLDSLGRATTQLGPLETDLFLRLSSGGRSSDTLQVRVRLPAFLGTLSVTARYPRYLGLEDEPIPTDGDTVLVPEGTRLETVGEATAPLALARWEAPESSVPLEVSGNQFRGSFEPRGTRSWMLHLGTASGAPLAGDTIRVPVISVPDSAPSVDVPVPGADTLVPITLKVPLVIDAEDDHGLARVVVESRRVSQLGFADSAREETVPLPEGVGGRAILPFELDLNHRDLLPGDTVRFSVRVSDNAPVAHTTRSREYVLRLPTLSEVRQAARLAASAVGARLDSLTRESQKLNRQTEDLAEERPRTSENAQGNTDESLSYENAKRAENVSEAQDQLVKQAEGIKEAIDALRRSAEAAGLNDPAWQARLQEIRDQLDRALTPELRERLAELQKALQQLDPERTKEALERLAQAQEKLRDALERSKELFQRAALEGDLQNLAAEARDLTEAQQQWNRQVETQDTARAAREEQSLAERTDSLSAALEKLAQQLAAQSAERQQAVAQAGQQANQAARQMQQAGESASEGRKAQAGQEGRKALEQLQPLGDQLQQQQEQLQQQWRQEVMQALDRVLGDASRLAERQLGVSESLRRGDTSPAVRAEQGAIKEGVERLLDQVKDVAGKNALVSQQSSVALAAGRDDMGRALDALSNASPNAREAGRQAGEAVDALNAAAYTLLRSRSAVQGASSGSGLQEALQQMSQMAQQQGSLSKQAGGLLPMMGGGAQVQEQLRQLAMQQRALAERMERLRAGGQMPGAAELAQEAKDLARRLEAGRLDRQTVQRQERLFRRMLDAGRTLQGQEQDEKQERQSTTAKDDSVHLPPALRARLNPADVLLRYPSWEELQSLSPEERGRVVEYFRRLGETAGQPKQAAP